MRRLLLGLLVACPLSAEAATIHYRLAYQSSTKQLVPVLWTTGDDQFSRAPSTDVSSVATQFALPSSDVALYEFVSSLDMREQIATQLKAGLVPALPGGAPLLTGVLPEPPVVPDVASVKRDAAIARLKAKGIDIQDVKDALSP